MKDLSVAQAFMLCALNEKGKFPALSAEIPVCMVAGSLADLLIEGCVAVDGKKVRTAMPLPGNLLCLRPLYDFIADKGPVKLDKLASEYCLTFTGKRIDELTDAVGGVLVERHCVTPERGGLFGNQELLISDENAVDGVVQYIRAEFLENGELSDEIVALAGLLEKSGLLKRYFSRYEKDTLKDRLKEIRKASSNEAIREILEYVDTVMTMIIIAAT